MAGRKNPPRKRPLRFGLRGKLLLAFFCLSLIPMGLHFAMGTHTTRTALTKAAYNSLSAAASQSALRLDAFVRNNLDVMATEARLLDLVEYLSREPGDITGEGRDSALEVLRAFAQRDPVFITSYALLDLQGRNVLDTVATNVGSDLSGRLYFREVLDTGLPVVSDVQFAMDTGRAGIYFAAPVTNAQGKPVGLLRARYSAAVLQQLAAQDTGLAGPQSFPLLLDANGLLLAYGSVSHLGAENLLYRTVQDLPRPRLDHLQQQRLMPPGPPELLVREVPGLAQGLARAGSTQPHFTTRLPTHGRQLLAGSMAALQSRPWLVAFAQPQEVFIAPVREQVRNTLVFALAVAAVTAVLGVAVAQLLTRPLARLTQAAQRIAQGDLTASVSVRSGDEIGVLAATFNRMALRLQKTLQGLRESEEQYRGIYENAVEGIYRTSPEGRLLHANPAMAHMLGYDSSREILERLTDIRHQLYVNPTDRDRFLHRLHEEGDVHDFEVQFRRKDGSLMWGALHARLVRDDQGQVLYIEGLLNDVTRRKEAEQQLAELNHRLERMVDERTADLADKARELERANRRLLEMDELKSAFLSSVSHELRTPLTSVLGFAKLIRKDFARSFLPGEDAPPGMRKKSGRILDNLRVIEQEGERLTRMINDFLDLSKIESGRVDWHDTDVDPAAVVQHVTRAVQGQFSQKPQVRLRVRVAENLPVLHMDPDRLEQVLLNLLGNASKFTDQGHVDLDVAPHDGAVRFQVTDTGPGIPEHDLERIFDKFHQVRKSDTVSEKPVGTGLGLAICRQIVEHYGGSIHVFSELGKGSVFTVDLPAAETRAAHSRTMPHPRRHMAPHERTRPLLLVVDDDLPTCAFLTQLLEQEGYEVAAAYDGESALEAAHDLAPDLVTMDLLMPGMDGRVTIQRMREDQYLAHIPILVISVLRDADRAGGDAALRKPVDEHALLDTVHALLGQRAGTRDILVLQAEPADVEALNSLTTRRVRHLDESELWEQVGAGFHGTVIVPGHLEQDLDLARLSSAQGVQVLILPKTALEYLRRS